MCAAMLLADLDFVAREGGEVWYSELLQDDAEHDVHHAYADELRPSFWTGLFAGTEVDLMDPHGVVYTSAYQSTVRTHFHRTSAEPCSALCSVGYASFSSTCV